MPQMASAMSIRLFGRWSCSGRSYYVGRRYGARVCATSDYADDCFVFAAADWLCWWMFRFRCYWLITLMTVSFSLLLTDYADDCFVFAAWSCVVQMFGTNIAWSCVVQMFVSNTAWSCVVQMFVSNTAWSCVVQMFVSNTASVLVGMGMVFLGFNSITE